MGLVLGVFPVKWNPAGLNGKHSKTTGPRSFQLRLAARPTVMETHTSQSNGAGNMNATTAIVTQYN